MTALSIVVAVALAARIGLMLYRAWQKRHFGTESR